ncbi:MAG: hypothetical protein JW894_08710 [Bacteroidales bacterium]|nr:hypothetical protein [Bacteroidales bacterium]
MGGEGSTAGMIVSLRNNRDLFKQRMKPFNKDRIDYQKRTSLKSHFKKVSVQKLEKPKKIYAYITEEMS